MKFTSVLIATQLPLLAVEGYERKLQPWRLAPLPLGSVKPRGWLKAEMESMATGLPGHEHDFYVYVNESSWLQGPGNGGTEYSNLNEALPYWFNGLVPLAYALDDDRLKRQVHDVADTVLSLQTSDGWIGPEVMEDRNFWARTPFFLGLTQLADANSTWEKPILSSLRKFMDLTNTMLKNDSQGFTNCAKDIDCSWGQVRIQDLDITIQWMLDNHPSSEQDSLLWDNMDMFYSQNQYKWDEWYTESTFPKVVSPDNDDPFAWMHGVNVGQGLKASSVIYRINGSERMVQKSHDAVDLTFTYHGSASGTVLADEKERDLAPYMGSELCTAVETAYSLAYMYQVLGTNTYADRTERTIFNAMPVMMTSDKWAHQHMDQPNQPFALNMTLDNGTVPEVFSTANSGVATTFGMEPQYPCCTVNHPQGYPKFLSNSWVAIGDRGLGHALLSPSTVETTVNDCPVTIDCETSYPFDNSLEYTVHSECAFDFYVRVPDWADLRKSSIATGSSKPSSCTPDESGMHRVSLKPGQTLLKYTIGTGIRTESRSNNTVSIFYGNLLYALDVGHTSTTSDPHAYSDPTGPPLSDLPFPELRDEFVRNTKPWNVAVDPSTVKFKGAGRAYLQESPFELGAAPTSMSIEGCEIDWPLHLDTIPDWAPEDRTCKSRKRQYRLVPYGSASVHMSDLPVTQL